MRRSDGFTLLEALIALAIFGLIVVIATTGVTGALRAQSLSQSVTASQDRLRRTTEVFTQELRGAILGGISNYPYTSDAHDVSFVTLAGGAGYPVLMGGYDDASTFASDDNLVVLWGGSGDPTTLLPGKQMLMVDGGNALLFTVDAPSGVTSLGNDAYQITHSSCGNTLSYSSGAITIQSQSAGFHYDSATRTLYLKEGTAAAVPMAFDLDAVDLQYVYQKHDGTVKVLSAPLSSGGIALRSGTVDGQSADLARITLTLSTSNKINGRDVSRTVSGTVEMSSNDHSVNQVISCQ